MTRIATATMGAYNERRTAQAQATRARILEKIARDRRRVLYSLLDRYAV